MKSLVLAGVVFASGIGVLGLCGVAGFSRAAQALEADHVSRGASGWAYERAVYAPGPAAQAESGDVLPWHQEGGGNAYQPSADAYLNTYRTAPVSQVQVEPLGPASGLGPTGASYCRESFTSATIAGQMAELYGTACQRPDGAWEIVGPTSFRAP